MVIGSIFGLAILFIVIGYLIGSILFGQIVSKIKNVDLRSQGSGNVGATNAMRIMGKTIGFIVMALDFFKAWLPCFLSLIIYKHLMPTITDSFITYQSCGVIIYLSGLFAVIGHCFPIAYLVVLFKTKLDFEQANKYSGGKGVSSAAGLMAAISPWIFFICFILFFSIAFISKYVSLSSIIATLSIPIAVLIPWLDYLYLLNVLDANILSVPSLDKAYEIANVINYSTNWWYILTLFLIAFITTNIVVYRHKSNIIRLMNHQENKLGSKKK